MVHYTALSQEVIVLSSMGGLQLLRDNLSPRLLSSSDDVIILKNWFGLGR